MKLKSFSFVLYGLLGMALFFITGLGSFFFIGILSLGGMSDQGRIISYFLYGAVISFTILPPFIAGLSKYHSSRSILRAGKDFFLALILAVLPALTIFAYLQISEYKQDTEYKKIVYQDNEDLSDWYTPVSAPMSGTIHSDWKQYDWHSDSQNKLIAGLQYPDDFQPVIKGYSKSLSGDGITIFFGERVIDQKRNHDTVFTSYTNDTLTVPYGGFKVNRKFATLSQYTVGKYTVFRADQGYFDDYSYSYQSLIFWEDPSIYTIEAVITGTTDQENKSKVELVNQIFDTLVVY